MRPVVRDSALLCVVLIIQNTISMKENPREQAGQELAGTKFPQKALEAYHNLINKAQAEKPECTLDHEQRYEVLNQSTDAHWQTCLKTSSNVLRIMSCMKDKAHGDMETLLHNIGELQTCIGGKGNTSNCSKSTTCVAEWAKQVAEVKNNLTAVKKSNEFYVAVENAKLANRTNCYNQYHPLVAKYAASIDFSVGNCYKFVPMGHLEEFKKCCDDLLQPIQSDMESKLKYLTDCWT